MISYGDRPFCSHSDSCATEKCYRNFNAIDRAAARMWWGGDNPPVAFADYRETECGFAPRAAALPAEVPAQPCAEDRT